jgi:hypothetical protein
MDSCKKPTPRLTAAFGKAKAWEKNEFFPKGKGKGTKLDEIYCSCNPMATLMHDAQHASNDPESM